jgi:hypothetical protein
MNFMKLVLSCVLFASSWFFVLLLWKVELCLVKVDHVFNVLFLFANGNDRCNVVFYPAVGVPSLNTAYQAAVVAMVVMHPLRKAVGK